MFAVFVLVSVFTFKHEMSYKFISLIVHKTSFSALGLYDSRCYYSFMLFTDEFYFEISPYSFFIK